MVAIRTENSIRNISTALVGQVFGILISFVSRLFFVRILGTEYLGINGLFTNILSMLSLAEMGFGTAIIYNLYKPLATNDFLKVKALINFYAMVYRIIGVVILALGLFLLPFLGYFIKSDLEIHNINVIYLLFLANSVVTYFYAHKRSLIIADQKNHIITIYRYAFYTILNILQIIILIITKNFIMFLVLQIASSLFENLFVSRKAEKLYPYLKYSQNTKLDKDSKRIIFKNVRAMICHRLGSVVVSGTDNILISSFVGVSWVGLYSNYVLIVAGINSIINQLFASVTASVGNLNAVENQNKTNKIFNSIYFINFYIIGICSISLYILFNPFITIWIGKDYLMNDFVVLLIVINFYATGMRKSTVMFKDTFGLFWNDRYKPLFESIINLLVSVILLKHLGLIGVFIGTFTSTMTTCFWVEPYILYKHAFKKSVIEYFNKYAIYTTVTIITGTIVKIISILFASQTILSFLALSITCFLVSNLIFIICFYKTMEFKYLVSLIQKLICKYYNTKKAISNHHR